MSLQKSFLDLVREKSNDESFVDELSDLLSISKDSAYRRLRGETPLHFDEIQKLSIKYDISVDQFFGLDASYITLKNQVIDSSGFKLINFLQNMLEDFTRLESISDKEVVFAAKDIPPFHFFQYENLTRFKLYFWLQNVEVSEDIKGKSYADFDEISDYTPVTSALWEKYIRFPSVEIWSDETVNIVLRHIYYFYDSGMLEPGEAEVILDELELLLSHIKSQAEQSKKFLKGRPEGGFPNTFKMYYNEVSISDNTVYYNAGEHKTTILTYNLLNTLRSSDEEFCANVDKHLQNIISKSSLISSVSERMRNKVFNQMHQKVKEMRRRLI